MHGKNAMQRITHQNPKHKPLKRSPARQEQKFGVWGAENPISRDLKSPQAGHLGSRSISPPLETALKRVSRLYRYRELRASGIPLVQAARDCGASAVTLWRDQQRLFANGLEGLLPQTFRCGRRSMLRDGVVTPAMIDQVRLLCLAVGNVKWGWRLFTHLPACPRRLAGIIRKAEHIPPALRRQTALKQGPGGFRRAGSNILIRGGSI